MNIVLTRVRASMMLLVSIAMLGIAGGCAPGVPPSDVSTLAGSTAGFADGPGDTAQFNAPIGVAVSPNGAIYVADTNNHRIRVINPATGQVATLAGTGIVGHVDGPFDTAQFGVPMGLAIAPDGTIYVAEALNNRIRAIDPANGQVTTLAGSDNAGNADGPGDTAQFKGPTGVAVAPDGTVYVADNLNHRIRAIDPATREVTTLAGTGGGFADGHGTSARFNRPAGVAVAPDGTVYVADYFNHRIRAIDPATSEVTTLAGTGTPGYADGPGDTAQFGAPADVTFGGGTIYVSEQGNNRIRTIDPATAQVTTFAGSGVAGSADGPSLSAQFDLPTGVTVDSDGIVYVADTNNHRIRRITLTPTG